MRNSTTMSPRHQRHHQHYQIPTTCLFFSTFEFILPFLDYKSWRNLSLLCRKAHGIVVNPTMMLLQCSPPWPIPFTHIFHNKNNSKKIITKPFLSFSCNGKNLAITTPQGQLFVVNCWKGILKNNNLVVMPNNNDNNNKINHAKVKKALFSPTNPSRIAIGFHNKHFQIWDIQETTTTTTTSILVDGKKNEMVYNAFNICLKIMVHDFPQRDNNSSKTIVNDEGSPTGVIAWSPDGNVLANAHHGNKIFFHRIDDEKGIIEQVKILSYSQYLTINHLEFAPNHGRYLVALGGGSKILVWNLIGKQQQQQQQKDHQNNVSIESKNNIDYTYPIAMLNGGDFAFSPCQQYIVTTEWGISRTNRIWKLENNTNCDYNMMVTCVAKFSETRIFNKYINFHPKDPTKLISLSSDGKIKIWQILIDNDSNDKNNNSNNNLDNDNNNNNNNNNNSHGSSCTLRVTLVAMSTWCRNGRKTQAAFAPSGMFATLSDVVDNNNIGTSNGIKLNFWNDPLQGSN